jgi:hypothetical protein
MPCGSAEEAKSIAKALYAAKIIAPAKQWLSYSKGSAGGFTPLETVTEQERRIEMNSVVNGSSAALERAILDAIQMHTANNPLSDLAALKEQLKTLYSLRSILSSRSTELPSMLLESPLYPDFRWVSLTKPMSENLNVSDHHIRLEIGSISGLDNVVEVDESKGYLEIEFDLGLSRDSSLRGRMPSEHKLPGWGKGSVAPVAKLDWAENIEFKLGRTVRNLLERKGDKVEAVVSLFLVQKSFFFGRKRSTLGEIRVSLRGLLDGNTCGGPQVSLVESFISSSGGSAGRKSASPRCLGCAVDCWVKIRSPLRENAPTTQETRTLIVGDWPPAAQSFMESVTRAQAKAGKDAAAALHPMAETSAEVKQIDKRVDATPVQEMSRKAGTDAAAALHLMADTSAEVKQIDKRVDATPLQEKAEKAEMTVTSAGKVDVSDEELADPLSLQWFRSHALLQWLCEDIRKQTLTAANVSHRNHLIERFRQGCELFNAVDHQIKEGELTQEHYVAQVTERLAKDEALAKALVNLSRKQEALEVLRRVKVVRAELAG